MNAGTAHITNMSPYYVRTSFSMWHAGHALGEAAAKQLGAKTAVVGYTDFPPGKDTLAAFKMASRGAGGKVIDEIPMGGANAVPDFTPFFQRAKDKKPDVFFVFVPAGDHSTAVVRTYNALGMKEAGIKLIGPGDITQDTKLQPMGQSAVGLITMHHYNADLDNPENKKLRRGLEEGIRRRIRRRISWRLAAMTAWRRSCTRSRRPAASSMATRRLTALKGWKYRQPARPDHDRSGHPRHHHERISVAGFDSRTGACAEDIGKIERREGRLQGEQRSVLAPSNSMPIIG